jgi:hypothetical protein
MHISVCAYVSRIAGTNIAVAPSTTIGTKVLAAPLSAVAALCVLILLFVVL